MNQYQPVKLILLFISLWMHDIYAQQIKYPIDTSNCQTLIQSMFDSIYALEYSEFEMISYERIDGVMEQNHASGIIQYTPRKAFLRAYNSENEISNEILYLEGANNNDALISPNGFPYFNLNLNPIGSLMRKGRHLTILDAGGRYLADMLKTSMVNSSALYQFEEITVSPGITKLIINNLNYGFISHTLREEGSLREHCHTLGIPEYKVLEINQDIDNYDYLKPGQIIQIPNQYAKRLEITIRESDFVPMHIKIFDDEGLFSEYEYIYFNSNPVITTQTFSENNPAYTF